ncbi:MAG TPA: hypothetical protein VH063_01785 [Gaiellaceae bacterium]|nr:hypothetical protein [Gaiellaceae bacterium]
MLVLGGCLAIGAANVKSETESDSWLSLLAGRLIVHNGLPHHDTLTSLTLGRAWVDQQWLAHVVLYGLWAAGGWALALLVATVLYTAAFAVLAGSARLRKASDRSVAVVTVFCFLAGLTNTAYRAQILSYLLFALVLALVLADERRSSRWVYLVIPVLVVWANVHGSVLIGAVLVTLRGALFGVSALRRHAPARGWLLRAGILVGAPWLAVLASPYALGLPGYYRSVLGNSELARASSEWGASTLGGQPWFYGLLVVGVLIVVLGRRSLTPFGALAFALTAALGILGIRNVAFFALAAAAVLPAALDRAWPAGDSESHPRLNLALGLTGLIAGVAVFGGVATHPESWFAPKLPTGGLAAVAKAAAADPTAEIFADEEHADGLLFEEPALAGRIAYDIRYELLTPAQLRRIVAFRKEQGTDWPAAVRPYKLLVLDQVSDAGAIRLFEREPGTTVLFPGPYMVVLKRATG